MKGTLVFCDKCTVEDGQHAFYCPSGKGVLKLGVFPPEARKAMRLTIEALVAEADCPSLFEIATRPGAVVFERGKP